MAAYLKNAMNFKIAIQHEFPVTWASFVENRSKWAL